MMTHNKNILFLLCIVLTCTYGEDMITSYATLPRLFDDSEVRTNTKTNINYLNTDYLGAGYNILKGNPVTLSPATGRDPGWITNRILSFSYLNGSQTSDGLYYVPDGASIQSIRACTYAATGVETFGVHSYTQNLDTYASVGGKSFAGSFSMSVGYASTKSTTTMNHDVIVQSTAICQAYVASIYPFKYYSYPLTSAFLKALELLPTVYARDNFSVFEEFFSNWGTHVSQQTVMGGRASSFYQFSNSAYDDLQSSAVDINAAASASWGGFSGDTSTRDSYSKESTEYFNKKTASVSRTYLGPTPPMNPSNLNLWMANVVSSPFALSYTLVPIDTLIASTNFSNKADVIKTALEEICALTEGCEDVGTVGPDPVHVPTVSTCRMCKSCGSNFPIESGAQRHLGDWGPWDAYDDFCSGTYQQHREEVKLCCGALKTDPNNGMCRFCASCGDKWPTDLGSGIHQDDWGQYRMWSNQCSGGYDDNPNEPHLCCETQTQCKLCDSRCGNGFTEVGRTLHIDDWGPWRVYPAECAAGNQITTKNEAAVCCK